MLLTLSLLACASEVAPPPGVPPVAAPVAAPVPPPSPFVEVAPVAPAALPEAALAAARLGDWSGVIGALPEQPAAGSAEAFLRAWALVRADRAAEAAPLLDGLGTQAPAPWVALARGRILAATGRPAEAAEALAQVPDHSSLHREAAAARAEVLAAAGQGDEALAQLRALAGEADTAAGGAAVLLALARQSEGEERAALLDRLYAAWPGTPEDAEGAALRPPTVTVDLASRRAEALMDRSSWEEVITLLTPLRDKATGASVEACRLRYALGRSHYKLNHKDKALTAFGSAVRDCADTDYGVQLAYLAARTEYRKGNLGNAARQWMAMSERYPDHRYADDGYTLAGQALAAAGDRDGARAAWAMARQRHPDGDMTPQATLMQAWTLYLDGRGEEARAVAVELAAMPPTLDPDSVSAGMYWAGRWALYPDVNAPNQRVDAGLQEAVARWTTLTDEVPFGYYAVLAVARLREEAPERAPGASEAVPLPQRWSLPRELTTREAFTNTGALLGLGLVGEASAEWATLPAEDIDLATRCWWVASRYAAGDAIQAHRELRAWITEHPVTHKSEGGPALLALAHPDLWLADVTRAAEGYAFPPAYFHALVRVESNFDPAAISWAGARGLSQVMPATGKGVGKWMGRTITADDLLDPKTNLEVGTRYMEFLWKRYGGSPYLSAAGYNAGENRVDQWLKEWGALPIDEVVERIPYDETRAYARRVVGTWQTYRWLRGEGFPELERFNHAAKPLRPTASGARLGLRSPC